MSNARPARRPAGQGVKFRGPIAGITPAAPVVDPGTPDPPEASSAANQPIAEGGPPPDLVALGRIVDAYGIRGWVKVESYNRADDSVLGQIRRWWIRPGQARQGVGMQVAQAKPLACEIERVRSHGGLLVAKPNSSHDRDTAIALKGFEVLASRHDFPASAEDEFYWRDLVGCEVVNPQSHQLGRVFAVEDYGAHPILRLKSPEGQERMIPFIGVYIVSVDLAEQRIIADWSADY